MRIAALYDQELVSGEAELQLGAQLRRKFEQTQEAVLQVCAFVSQSRAHFAAVPPLIRPPAPAAAASTALDMQVPLTDQDTWTLPPVALRQ